MTTRRISLRRIIPPALSALALLILALVGGCCPPTPACPTTPATPTRRPTPTAQPTPTMDEMHAAFQWFDGLGYPDLKGRKYVHVATGNWWQSSGSPPENTYIYAFLLEDNGEEFTVFATDLLTRTFVKTPPDTETHERVEYETLEFRSMVAEHLETLKQRQEESSESEWVLTLRAGKVTLHSQLFVLARACAANDMDPLAYEAFTFAAQHALEHPERTSLSKSVANDIANATMWRNILAFQDTSISRQELLERFDLFVKQFPESEHTARAKDTARILRQMVKEDKKHTPPPNMEALSEKERIAELIFQLRDQNGHQWGQPGACDIFSDERDEASPAHQLVKIGYPAIPQLIKALEDERFTRSVEYHRDFYFSHYTLTVGDAALSIIERISNRSFHTLEYTGATMNWENRDALINAEVKAWWREFQKKGEKQLLIEAVESGSYNSDTQARLLIERYPDVAVAAIEKGLHNAGEWAAHCNLVRVVAYLQGDDPIPLLLSVSENAPYFCSRFAAAKGLQWHGHPEGLAAMLEEWANPREIEWDDERSYEDLAKSLVNSGDPQAIQTTMKNFYKWPVGIRLEVIRSGFRERGPAPADGSECPECESPETTTAIEDLLIFTLDDVEENSGLSTGLGDLTVHSPRNCDLAGYELAKHWPDRYKFDPGAPLSERDIQIVAMKNVWRQAHGLAALPLSQRPVIPRVPGGIVQPLLDRIVQTGDQKAIRAIEALGLGALPAVKARLAGLEENHPARLPLATLAANLANIIREVVIAPDSVAPDPATREYLEALEGEPLTSQVVVDLLLRIANEMPHGITGIKIRADRNGDDTGVVLNLTLTRQRAATRCFQQVCWAYDKLIVVNNKSTLNSFGSMDQKHGQTEAAYEELVKALDEALATPPDGQIMIKTAIILQNPPQQPQAEDKKFPAGILIAIPTAAIALLVAFWLWRRRRRQVPQDAGEESEEPVDPIVE
ncbi:MAG: hypothetical protein JXA21_14360 [Anaerolineae bacterium]|nr:hypothetical protein [Anaerolineae bacterium]